MSEKPSNFVWYDLMTTDPAGAAAFYHDVIGWEAKDSGLAGPPYTLLSVGEAIVGGLTGIPEDAHNPAPAWLGHIGVDDVDACAARITEAGGSIYRAPRDIPEVGRFAVAGDPYGAVFLIFQPLTPMPGPVRAMPPPPGHVGWHELHAGDGEGAFLFYSGLFGWTKLNAVDMGPMGVYQMFAAGDVPVGGMMTKMPEMPTTTWMYYFQVEGATATAAKIRAAGGTVMMGPQEVPGGSWIVQGLDPQGAMFAVVSNTQ